MELLIQILVSLLILISFILIINIPIALATPGEWEMSKNKMYNIAKLWGTLVLLTGFAQSFS